MNRPLSLSDRGGDKPDAFSLPPLSAASVDAPLIDECNANFECRRANTQLVNRYKSFVLEVIEALIDGAQRNQRTLHYRGRGAFFRPMLASFFRFKHEPYSMRQTSATSS